LATTWTGVNTCTVPVKISSGFEIFRHVDIPPRGLMRRPIMLSKHMYSSGNDHVLPLHMCTVPIRISIEIFVACSTNTWSDMATTTCHKITCTEPLNISQLYEIWPYSPKQKSLHVIYTHAVPCTPLVMTTCSRFTCALYPSEFLSKYLSRVVQTRGLIWRQPRVIKSRVLNLSIFLNYMKYGRTLLNRNHCMLYIHTPYHVLLW
jgi:hypothetical protein